MAEIAVPFRQMRQRPAPNAYYVALGSSYAAGYGLGRRAHGSPIISRRSINGYPQQLARLLKVQSFTDMSSSGSTVRQILHGGQLGLGPQIDALGPDTKLVTMTAGGNDIGFIGDLMMMAYRNRGGLAGLLVDMIWKGAKPLGDRDFASLEVNLKATIHEIRRRSPGARLVVATYPTILPVTGTCTRLGITSEQAAMMRPVGDTLVKITRAAVAGTDTILVDMASLSTDHDACSTEPWVNGAPAKQGANFHPNLAGARATAHAIAQAIGKNV